MGEGLEGKGKGEAKGNGVKNVSLVAIVQPF